MDRFYSWCLDHYGLTVLLIVVFWFISLPFLIVWLLVKDMF